jgi:hypothetical protein
MKRRQALVETNPPRNNHTKSRYGNCLFKFRETIESPSVLFA